MNEARPFITSNWIQRGVEPVVAEVLVVGAALYGPQDRGLVRTVLTDYCCDRKRELDVGPVGQVAVSGKADVTEVGLKIAPNKVTAKGRIIGLRLLLGQDIPAIRCCLAVEPGRAVAGGGQG